MWSQLYRNHFIMPFPSFDTATNAWAPQADISWSGGPSRESQFIRFPKRFMTEREAVTFAIKMGQTWINKRLKRPPLAIGSDRGQMVDMIRSLKGNLERTAPKQLQQLRSPVEPQTETPFTFDQFKSAIRSTGLKISPQKLQKSYAALVKLRQSQHLSWAETRRKVQSSRQRLRAAQPRTRQSKVGRLPVTELGWRKIS
jgi:hypothetical protein